MVSTSVVMDQWSTNCEGKGVGKIWRWGGMEVGGGHLQNHLSEESFRGAGRGLGLCYKMRLRFEKRLVTIDLGQWSPNYNPRVPHPISQRILSDLLQVDIFILKYPHPLKYPHLAHTVAVFFF